MLHDVLEKIKIRYEEVDAKLMDSAVYANPDLAAQLGKEKASLQETYDTYSQYTKIQNELEENKELLEVADDAEMKELILEEIKEAQAMLPKLEEELQYLILPKDPNDDKNIIIELRPNAGGDEAGLFADDMLTMYQKYADMKGWKFEILEYTPSDVGGLKFASIQISGQNVYSFLKYENGVHRVQRIPKTESGGRIHTSTATALVYPELDDVKEIDLKESDIKVETFRASGAGGQHVNTTDSAVRLIHEPTGVVTSCQSERSQLQNKDRAMKLLKIKLYELAQEEKRAEEAQVRSTVGKGDRSEKIRTYNWPQNRITDHRIPQTWNKLDRIIIGDLDPVVTALIEFNKQKLMEEQEKNNASN